MAKQFSESGNQSSSVLTITPTREDDGKHLTCRAENAFVPESSIEDKWRLVVHCTYYIPPRDLLSLFLHYHLMSPADVPMVTLKMGPNLNPNDIKVGDDVYYECHIQGNPKPYKLAWFHNVRDGWIKN